MPRYFFHLVEGERLFPDHKGEDLPNDEAARDEARRVAEALRARGPRGALNPRRFVVTDGYGRVVTEAPVLTPGRPGGH
jgi:hypothetical protein